MAMSNNKEYVFAWNDHATNLSNSFFSLLQNKEMVDVTLAADKYLVEAHRTVLSAISPYFHRMFSQMPANQHAIVFMKDVSKQTLEDLIKFIYTGEVNVAQDNLEEFLNAAKGLDIKCLGNDSYAQLPIPNVDRKSVCSPPVYDQSQYQSTQTVRRSESNQNEYKNRSLYADDPMDDYDGDMAMTTNQQNGAKNDCLQSKMDELKTLEANQPRAKRFKRALDLAEYNIVADIRINKSGHESMFIENHKLSKNRLLKSNQQRWKCTRHASAKCKASAHTVNVDGVQMMKILKAEHNHEQ